MRQYRSAAVTAGILYIVGSVSGALSKVFVWSPMHNASDPFAYAAQHATRVTTGAVLVLVMGLALAFVPVVLYPLLRQVDQVLATGYLILRGAVETVCYILSVIAWLMIVPLGAALAAGPGTASPIGVRLAALLIDSDAIAILLSLVFCLGGVCFYTVLYRSGIAPRWIAAWGLLAVPSYAAAYLLAMYSVIGAQSAVANLLDMPLAVQEMVLAVWMIARGFRPAIGQVGSEPEAQVDVPDDRRVVMAGGIHDEHTR